MIKLDRTPEVWNIPIGERGMVEAIISSNPLGLTPERLFSLGYRFNNSKRSFMFVSKVLGKHTPINPMLLQETTESLAEVYFETQREQGKIICKKRTLIIGFAEAATAMAHSFFDVLDGDVAYIHSTREQAEGLSPFLSFSEVHSHAPHHNFYLIDKDLIENAEEIILVDDEVTSGKTALAVIKLINSLYPGKKYGVAAFLDWRNKEDITDFDLLKDAGVPIKCSSLLQGEIDLQKLTVPLESIMPVYEHVKNFDPGEWGIHNFDYPTIEEIGSLFLKHTGRFGLDQRGKHQLDALLESSAANISQWLPEGRSLFLGTGEFLYIPLKLAELMGESVSFQSITRTPNVPLPDNNYDIHTLDVFPSPTSSERFEYLYNLQDGDFDNLVLFFERSCPIEKLKPLLSVLEKKGFQSINLVFFCG